MPRVRTSFRGAWPTLLALLLAAGCSRNSDNTRTEVEPASDLFDRITREYHLPSGEAEGRRREELLEQAADGYQLLLNTYPDQAFWAAQALRSLGNVRAVQGNLEEAIRSYERVATEYPEESWEVLQSWKSAADLLDETGQTMRAHAFLQQIVDRFDDPQQPAIVRTIVAASKSRLTAR